MMSPEADSLALVTEKGKLNSIERYPRIEARGCAQRKEQLLDGYKELGSTALLRMLF
jgi:hypothetical protein